SWTWLSLTPAGDILMNFPDIQTYCAPILNLTIVFSDVDSNEINNFISKLALPEKKINDLRRFFSDSFSTSFSWGFAEQEFVFIRLEKTSPLLRLENQRGLRGLILHEILHSVQRQRGFEVSLRSSLVLTLDLFEQLAAMVPSEHFDKNEIISFLTEISQVAFYTLKDIYVNYELIKRGYGELLLDYYKSSLGFEESNLITPPRFETSLLLKKGKKDLIETARAFNYTTSLLPTWLPFMQLDMDSKYYEISRQLKNFVFSHYYPSDSILTNEIIIMFENILLTSFTFSSSFHVKWFGAIFNIALEFLLGEDFVFYHLAKAAELIEEYYSKKENTELLQPAIAPILKATYLQKQPTLHQIDKLSGVQQTNIEALEELFRRYEIDQEELGELEEMVVDKEPHEVGHVFQNLLKLSIMVLSKDLRFEIIHGHQNGEIKILGRAILTLLQALNYLGNICDDKYYHEIRITVKRILRIADPILQKQLVLYLETVAKSTIYPTDVDAKPEEAKELIFYFDFFSLPISNITIDLGLSYINGIKMTLRKVPVSDPEFPPLMAQLAFVLTAEMANKLSQEEMDSKNMYLVSSLLASSGIPYNLIQPILENYITYIMPQQEEDSPIQNNSSES
ncbi:MAG: hypothetical protein ACFFDT_07350, partial [Candidatus Hodarchaeota archaeon]